MSYRASSPGAPQASSGAQKASSGAPKAKRARVDGSPSENGSPSERGRGGVRRETPLSIGGLQGGGSAQDRQPAAAVAVEGGDDSKKTTLKRPSDAQLGPTEGAGPDSEAHKRAKQGKKPDLAASASASARKSSEVQRGKLPAKANTALEEAPSALQVTAGSA
ncbi:hypothetical protein DID78_02415 [Candidatus Marinamargulisbacteria bacterium SCGC AG-343-D04]|nr:hypothetical protein DID78_02415 [Candidatus Marinamargulisbacteria bacterium SCGC AG-343-D04]